MLIRPSDEHVWHSGAAIPLAAYCLLPAAYTADTYAYPPACIVMAAFPGQREIQRPPPL